MTKITDKPLEESCANGDGTYNGFIMARWLFEAMTGKPMSEEEARKIFDEAQQRAKERK